MQPVKNTIPTTEAIVNLYTRCATELPGDVCEKLRKSLEKEENDTAKYILNTILENIDLAKKESKPICQDTGTPIFYISSDNTISLDEIKKHIETATKQATEKIPLRPNAADPIVGTNTGNRPIIHIEQSDRFKIDLLMKGGGSENISAIYTLPDAKLNANKDIEGIKRCVLDAVFRAQGKGCPPYIIGVAIGGNIEQVAHLSKKQLLRNLNDRNKDEHLNKMETELLETINKLKIGPMGLGGKTTALSVKIAKSHRHPASYFIGISFSCWALRRQSL
ncbi:MAG: fumarate hydratase [Candidatus Nanohalarchaeota archaeon]|nr:MAG: fumarate hydratase [Candidatus Nanohaloarchaeota archaeon]